MPIRVHSQQGKEQLGLRMPFLTRARAEGVERLSLEGAGAADLRELALFPGLVTLEITRSRLRGVSFVRRFEHLSRLELADNDISDISPLGGMRALHSLGLGGNRVSRADVLGGMTGLRHIDLRGNGLYELPPLPLPGLTSLDARGNRLSRLPDLWGAEMLHEARLDGNALTSLDGLAGLEWLEFVHARGNALRDASALFTLPRLRFAALEGNPLPPAQVARLELLMLLRQMEPEPVDSGEYHKKLHTFTSARAGRLPGGCLSLLARLAFIPRYEQVEVNDGTFYKSRCAYNTEEARAAWRSLRAAPDGWAKARILEWCGRFPTLRVPVRVDEERRMTPPRGRGMVFYMTPGGVFGGGEPYVVDRGEYVELPLYG